MKIKTCKTCGAENSPADIECRRCMGDISGIRPVEKTDKAGSGTANPSATVRDVKKSLVLVSISAARNGDILSVNDGDILGREHVGRDLLAVYDTVSRQHAKIACSRERECEKWTIEDIGSTNGTYVNGRKLEARRKYPLKAKDIVALSKSCEFLVEIGG